MKALLHSFRQLFSVPKLHEENAQLRTAVEKLEAELDRMKFAASTPFHMVAKDFDASFLEGKVEQQVIDDLTPFLTEEAVFFLKQAFGSRDWKGSREYTGRAAVLGKPSTHPVYRVEFRAKAAGTILEVY